MAGVIKFTVFSAALIAVLLLVIVPLVVGPIVSGLVRDAGVMGDDVEVSVDVFGPSLLSGRAPSVRLQADDISIPRATIGRMDVTLTDVSPTERSFGAVSGTLWDVQVSGPGGLPVVVASIDLEGPAEAARATGRMDRTESEGLIREIAVQAGADVDEVTLGDGSLTIRHSAGKSRGVVEVGGDALILTIDGEDPLVLMAPAPSESWRLRDVHITPNGMRLDLTVDLGDIATQVTGQLR